MNFPETDRRQKRKVSAFTLLEVVVAMSILALLAGSVFAILFQTGMTAGEIREVDQRKPSSQPREFRRRRIDRFRSSCLSCVTHVPTGKYVRRRIRFRQGLCVFWIIRIERVVTTIEVKERLSITIEDEPLFQVLP